MEALRISTVCLAASAALVMGCGRDVVSPPEEVAILASHQGTAGPKTYTFDDGAAFKVRSDGRGAYVNGVDCVTARSEITGFSQLRTIRNSTVCLAQVRSQWRFLTIDNTGVDLDQDGIVAEPADAAPARFITTELFGHNATTTPVQIGVFHVNPDATTGGTTTADAEWVIQYQKSAPISTDPGTGARTITLSGSDAAADICRRDPRTGKLTNCGPTGVLLPFRVTVSTP